MDIIHYVNVIGNLYISTDNPRDYSHVPKLIVSCLTCVALITTLYMYMYITAAIGRYFESRKRLLRESEPNQTDRVLKQEKQRKIRSRRQRVS